MEPAKKKFAESLESGKPDKETLIDTLIARGQFLVGEKPEIVRNGLSTDLIVFPTDMSRDNRQRLEEKITDAIEYASIFIDVERLNALQYVPGTFPEGEKSLERWYLTLGLYLYFADECSRKNPNTTFLSALRDADVRLPKKAAFEPNELYPKMMEALQRAHIDTQKNLDILHQWRCSGSYTIDNDKYWRDEQGVTHGAYAQLAEKLTERFHHLHREGVIAGIGEAISYALGNKEHMQGFAGEKNDAAAYAHVKRTVSEPQDEEINEHVRRGNNIRRSRIHSIIFSENPQCRLFTDSQIFQSKNHQKEKQPTVRDILGYFPDDALELLLRHRQSFVYADEHNISSIFPSGNIPGSTPEENEDTRISTGGRLARYRTTFVSNGNNPPSDEHTRNRRVAQTALHELMHIASDIMKEDAGSRPRDFEKEELYRLAAETSRKLRGCYYNVVASRDKVQQSYAEAGYPNRKLDTITENSLPEVLDYQSVLYTNYGIQDEKTKYLFSPDASQKEEVLCNLFGLIHTEFNDRENPENPLYNPSPGMEVIREFAEKADAYFHHALERLREQQKEEGYELPLYEARSRGA